MSFEEDDERNLCLVAYPLSGDPAADLDISDLSGDRESKGKILQWGKMTPSLLVDNENHSCNSNKDKR